MSSSTSNGGHDSARNPVERAASLAYEIAELGPENVDVAEVHDACAAAELWLYDQLHFSRAGGQPISCFSGATSLDGWLPVNPAGLLARGHPLGATGAAQIVELVHQGRGEAGERQVEGARVGLAQISGGIFDHGDEAVAVVSILQRSGG